MHIILAEAQFTQAEHGLAGCPGNMLHGVICYMNSKMGSGPRNKR